MGKRPADDEMPPSCARHKHLAQGRSFFGFGGAGLVVDVQLYQFVYIMISDLFTARCLS